MEIDLPPRPANVALARWAVEELGDRLPLPVREDVGLLVTELVTNAIRHAGLEDFDAITLRVTIRRGTVHVDVVDHGLGFDAPPTPDRVPELPEGGMGLFLVDRIADRWGVERGGGTRVWFEKDFELRAAS